MQEIEAQREAAIIKFDDLPLTIQLAIQALNSSRRKERLYSLTGRHDKCESTREKMWGQYNHLVDLVKTTLAGNYTHVSVFKKGDLALVNNNKHAGKTYETGLLLRVPI